ncbi:MAG TPA: hypothetical protein VFO16_01725 [Pseudonocardiaceae bacterium]|nr:hypothetical protein [Pseudonocardiaceae bacterium]
MTQTGPVQSSPAQPGPETAGQPVVIAAPAAAASLRRAVPIAALLGAASFVVLVPAGHPVAGAFFCGGLGLGLFNTALVQRSAARFAARGEGNKRRFAASVLARLALVTAIAVGLAWVMRPDGLAVFAGLAAFQLLMIFIASVPLIRELRSSRAEVSRDE